MSIVFQKNSMNFMCVPKEFKESPKNSKGILEKIKRDSKMFPRNFMRILWISMGLQMNSIGITKDFNGFLLNSKEIMRKSKGNLRISIDP